ncbi:8580_t:CDS:2, partial [Cetraspora pellucida]
TMCESLERNEFSCESSSQTISESQNGYEFLDVVSSLELEVKTDSESITTCEYAKEQGFRIVKDPVQRKESIICRRTLLCEHSHSYDSTSNKDTNTKKTHCPFLVNTSCPKVNNPESTIVVNKIVYEHNHPLNRELIVFEDAKKFTNSMLEDVKFMTMYCKFRATVQRKFLERKYPTYPIHSKDLYRIIQRFRPTAKSLSNDAAQISNWLDQQKEKDPRWVIARGWDEDNILTHLLWMKPEQVENWIRYSDCVFNDVTHKTNCYDMALSLFVGFDNNRQNILLAQALLADESLESHIWMFQQIVKTTNTQSLVILTDADPAVNTAIHQLVNNYTKAQHYLEFLYKSKNYWAYCFTNFKFTGSMIATSCVESMNACLKHLIYNSNTSLCELATEIHKLLDIQDKENEYKFWKLAIPMIKHQEKVNFLFSKVDQFAREDMKSLDDDDLQFSSWEYSADDLQAMLKQMIEFVGLDDIEEL